jgi:16S rRNA (cytosine(967)-C(5))-methyltransferase
LAHRPPTTDARRLAWQVLTAVEQGAFADAALAARLRAAGLAPRDRALATQLVYGTLAWQGLLDHAVAQRDRDPRMLDAPIRTLLRLALFQLVRLERVPDFAAVDTAVELSKEVKRGAASGLVNALLRRFLREGKRIDLPPRAADLAAHLAVAYSHPRWLVTRWLDEFGAADSEALLAANNEPAPTVLRVNRRRSDPTRLAAALAEQGIASRPGTYARTALVVESHGELAALAGYQEGWFAPQGEASQLVVDLLDPRPGARILDACAAPGGKATAAAERVGDGGLVVALDRQLGGLRMARRAAARLGLDRLVVVQADAAAPPLDPPGVPTRCWSTRRARSRHLRQHRDPLAAHAGRHPRPRRPAGGVAARCRRPRRPGRRARVRYLYDHRRREPRHRHRLSRHAPRVRRRRPTAVSLSPRPCPGRCRRLPSDVPAPRRTRRLLRGAHEAGGVTTDHTDVTDNRPSESV